MNSVKSAEPIASIQPSAPQDLLAQWPQLREKATTVRLSLPERLALLDAAIEAARSAGHPAVAAEACALAARAAAQNDHSNEARRRLRAARAWAALADERQIRLLVELHDACLCFECGPADQGLRLARQVMADPGYGELPALDRVRLCTDLTRALLSAGRFDAGVAPLQEALHVVRLQSSGDLRLRMAWVGVTCGLMSLVSLLPPFETRGLPTSAPGPWQQAMRDVLAEALEDLLAQPAATQTVLGAGAMSVAQSALRIAAHAGLRRSPTTATAAYGTGDADSLAMGWISAYWAAVADLLDGEPSRALAELRRTEARVGPASDDKLLEVLFVQAQALRMLGRHREAMDALERHLRACRRLQQQAHQLQTEGPPQPLKPSSMPSPEVCHGWPPELQRAVQLASARALNGVRVAELAKAAGRSERWLRTAFLHHLGRAPLAYLQGLRLQAARSQLESGWLPQGGMQALAQACGYSHVGRFRRDFAREFGESARDVLARALRV